MAAEYKIIASLEYAIKGEEAFREQAKAAKANEAAISELSTKIKAYESLLKSAKTEGEKTWFTGKVKEARGEYEKLTGTMHKQVGVVEGLRAEIGLLEKALESAAETDLQGINKQLAAARNKLAVATNLQPTQSGGGISTGNSMVAGAVGGAVAAGVNIAIEGFKNLAGSIVSATQEYELFRSALITTFEGNVLDADASLSMLVDTAAKTPYALNEITDGFIKLKNTGLEPTAEQLIQISDLAASQGKSFGQLTEAIIDAQSMEFERLKEFGIRAEKNGDKIAFTFRQQRTEVAATSQEINKYIIGLGALSSIQGGSASAAKTLGGVISNLGDNFNRLSVGLGTSTGLIKDVVGAVSSLVGAAADYFNTPLSEKIEEERVGFEALSFQVLATKDGTVERTAAINALIQRYPEYLKNLSLETLTNQELADTLSIINGLYANRASTQFFQEQSKAAKQNLDDLTTDTANAFGKLLETIRVSAKNARVQINPLDLQEVAGDFNKLNGFIDQLDKRSVEAGGVGLSASNKAQIKRALQAYQELYNSQLSAQKDFSDKSNTATQAKNNDEIRALEELNKALNISIEANQRELEKDKKRQDLADQLVEQNKQKRINDLKIKLLKEGNALTISERKKLQDEIDKLEGKAAEKGGEITATERKSIENKAKQRKKAYAKANETLAKELDKQRTEIDKLQLPKGDNLDAIKKSIDLQKREELKSLDDRYNGLVEDLKEKGIGKAQLDALAAQKGDIEKAINEKFAIKLTFDLKAFEDAKQKAISDIAAKDFEFKANLRIAEIRADKNATIDDLQVANALARELASTKLESDLQARIDELTKTFGAGTPELAAAVTSLNDEYTKLLDKEAQKELEANGRDALAVLQKQLDKLQGESKREGIKIEINELAALEQLNNAYNAGLMSKKEYEDGKTAIQKEAAQLRLKETKREVEAELSELDRLITESVGKGIDTSELEKQRQEMRLRLQTVNTSLSEKDPEVSMFQQRTEAAQEYFDSIKTGYDALTQVVEQYLDATVRKEIEDLDASIEKQKEKVNSATELAKKGQTEALEREEAALLQLEQRREKAVAKERKINAAIQLSNQILAASYAALAIAKAIAIDPTGISTAGRIAAIVAAGAAGLGAILGIIASANSFTSAKEGKDFVGDATDKPISTDSTGTKEYLYKLHHGEMVLRAKDAEAVRKAGGIGSVRAIIDSEGITKGKIAATSAKIEHDSRISSVSIKGIEKQNKILEAQNRLLERNLSEIQRQNAMFEQYGRERLNNEKRSFK